MDDAADVGAGGGEVAGGCNADLGEYVSNLCKSGVGV